MNKYISFFTLVFFLGFNFIIFSQQEHLQNPPCNSLNENMLSRLVGNWSVEWNYRTSPGVFEKLSAQSSIKLDLMNCALVEDFKGALRGKSFGSKTMISQIDEKKYEKVRIDTEHGGFNLSYGQMTGDTLVFQWERDLGNRVLRTEHKYFDITKDSFTVEFLLSTSKGSPWQLVQRAFYKREY